MLLVILAICSAGCINMVRKSITGGAETDQKVPVAEPENTPHPVVTQKTVTPTIQQTAVEVTPRKSEVVVEVEPYTTPDQYPVIHGARINATPQYSFLSRTPEFTKTYSMSGNAVGLRVNVVEGPLYIVYTVEPKYDCLRDPDSCRGTVLVPVNRPYMTITVRDNQTHEIVAEDGYGREYSSDTGNYQFVITSTGDDSSTTETHSSEPGPRYIAVFREGQFHITIEGNYLDVNVKIITGASPDPLEQKDILTTTTTAPRPPFPREVPV